MTSHNNDVINYIDDIIGFTLPSKCNAAFQCFQDILRKLGFALNEKKIVKPQTKVCLAVNFTVAFPPEKNGKDQRNLL